MDEFVQITRWCDSEAELKFAVDELEKDGCKYKIEQQGKRFVVVRPRKDILPHDEVKVAPKRKTANSHSLLSKPADRMGETITEILQGKRDYSFMHQRKI